MAVVVVVAVAGDHEGVGKAVVGAEMEEHRGSDCSMTVGLGLVSWVARWLRVVDGQDVLDLTRMT